MSLRPEVVEMLKRTGVTVMPKSKTPKREIPQVYVSVSGGIADVMARGEVDVIEIDWDNVTPDSWTGEELILEAMESAMEDSERLPPTMRLANLRAIEKWLDMFLDPQTGYTEKDEFRKDAITVLKEVRSQITDLELE